MTTQELIEYYAELLILQYVGLPKAFATIETLVTPVVLPQTSTQAFTFSPFVPTSGTFKLSYGGNVTPAINWNDTNTTIQGYLQALPGLGSVTVSGSIAGENLIVTFTGVAPPALLLIVENNTLSASGNNISVTIIETDVTLPLAVQNAFNLIGPNIAVGNQLDVLGKYVGANRSGFGLYGQPITLSDSDYLLFIQMCIVQCSYGSDLSTIQDFMVRFFGTEILLFDLTTMRLSYFVTSTFISNVLLQLLITEDKLPRPMAVGYSVIYGPDIRAFFAFVTYDLPTEYGSPFNTYDVYSMSAPWLTYEYAIIP